MTDPWLPLRRQCERFIEAHRGDASHIDLESILVDIQRACEDAAGYLAAYRALQRGTDTHVVTGPDRVRAALIQAGRARTEEEKP